jgi:hypothetical protein
MTDYSLEKDRLQVDMIAGRGLLVAEHTCWYLIVIGAASAAGLAAAAGLAEMHRTSR